MDITQALFILAAICFAVDAVVSKSLVSAAFCFLTIALFLV